MGHGLWGHELGSGSWAAGHGRLSAKPLLKGDPWTMAYSPSPAAHLKVSTLLMCTPTNVTVVSVFKDSTAIPANAMDSCAQ